VTFGVNAKWPKSEEKKEAKALAGEGRLKSQRPSPRFMTDQRCAASGCAAVAESACSRCTVTYYCSPECQRADWPTHKAACKKLASEPPVGHPLVDCHALGAMLPSSRHRPHDETPSSTVMPRDCTFVLWFLYASRCSHGCGCPPPSGPTVDAALLSCIRWLLFADG
jgi:hypothetical protein